MRVRVVMEHDKETDSFAVYCPELPSCCSAGDTEAEALENIKEAIALYLLPVPLEFGPEGKVYEIEVAV